MTKPEELLELANRCEREEASFELECAIARAVGFYRPHPDLWRPKIDTPKYASSLDAALTLVPEGAEWSLTNLYGIARAECPLNHRDGWESASRKDGDVVLALCAAALRARAAVSCKGTGAMRAEGEPPPIQTPTKVCT